MFVVWMCACVCNLAGCKLTERELGVCVCVGGDLGGSNGGGASASRGEKRNKQPASDPTLVLTKHCTKSPRPPRETTTPSQRRRHPAHVMAT